jgi:multiple sugar transport system substrate-binding protein
MVKEGGMANLNVQAAQQAFAAGKLGLLYWTTAVLRGTIRQVGRNFDLRHRPDAGDRPGERPPAHRRRAGMLTARDPAKREAAGSSCASRRARKARH